MRLCVELRGCILRHNGQRATMMGGELSGVIVRLCVFGFRVVVTADKFPTSGSLGVC